MPHWVQALYHKSVNTAVSVSTIESASTMESTHQQVRSQRAFCVQPSVSVLAGSLLCQEDMMLT